MKKIILPLMAILLLSFTSSEKGLTDAEREAAVAEMTTTLTHVFEATNGLSEAQLNFKSSPESWSVAECVEHLALSETNIFGMLQGALETPADPSGRDNVKVSDDDLLAMIVDRSSKFKTTEAFEPSGKFGSFEGTVNELKNKREEHIKYVQETEDDLRNHYTEAPVGTIDAYQILLFMSGHTERHVLQMQEIMAHENFPKS